jgi:hypothetical protein
MNNVFAKEDNTDMMDTIITNIAASTSGSAITWVQTATIPDFLVANAINQLSTNQGALMNQMVAMLYAIIPPPPPLQPHNTNHQYKNSPFQCSNLLPQPQQTDSILEMEEVAEGGAANRGIASVGTGIINTHCLQAMVVQKMLGAMAEAAVVGDSFHRP